MQLFWRPRGLAVIWGPIKCNGFSDGTVVEFTRAVPAKRTQRRGFRHSIHVHRTTKAGSVSITLNAGAEENTALALIAAAEDTEEIAIYHPLSVYDDNIKLSIADCPAAAIEEDPVPNAGEEGPDNLRWTFGGDPFIIKPIGISLAVAKPSGE